jgi:large subunit ribosomal protein L13
MDTRSYKTMSANKETAVGKWYIVDADGEVLGRLCTRIAHVLRGKHRPDFTPHVDCGDCVIVINADKVRVTGDKANQKEYTRFSLYPGGLKKVVYKDMMDVTPERIIETGVRGMLPKNKLGRGMFRKLYVYAGGEHPHQAQQPETLKD